MKKKGKGREAAWRHQERHTPGGTNQEDAKGIEALHLSGLLEPSRLGSRVPVL